VRWACQLCWLATYLLLPSVLVLLDPRIRKQRYGQTFLASLPPYRMTATITDVESFFEAEDTKQL